MTALYRSIELPPGFRIADVLTFHRRDASRMSEKVDAGTLQKGMAWDGSAACLTIRFHSGRADAELAVDGASGTSTDTRLERVVRRMLGLEQRVEQFEEAYRAHPQLGRLIARHPGLRVPLAASPFEALTWAVTGQQISVSAATSVRRRLIAAAGLQHSGGLACFPDAGHVARLSEDELREAGFSKTKAATVATISRLVQENLLPLDSWCDTLPVEEMRKQLLLVRGIGPWTVSYTLLRGFGWLDGSLHGDVAVRRGLQLLLGGEEKIDEEQARQWLADFSPWRALVAAHLWAMLSTPSSDGFEMGAY